MEQHMNNAQRHALRSTIDCLTAIENYVCRYGGGLPGGGEEAGNFAHVVQCSAELRKQFPPAMTEHDFKEQDATQEKLCTTVVEHPTVGPIQIRVHAKHTMAAKPDLPSPHVDIFAYLVTLEARTEALEAAREAQEALNAETVAGALFTRLEATLHVLSDMPIIYEGELPSMFGDRLRAWANKVHNAAT
jgi:hypothetical protein